MAKPLATTNPDGSVTIYVLTVKAAHVDVTDPSPNGRVQLVQGDLLPWNTTDEQLRHLLATRLVRPVTVAV